LGIELGRPMVYDGADEASAATCQPLWVPIDDVAELFFYSSDADAVIDVLYFVG